jgi:hypothetical protein
MESVTTGRMANFHCSQVRGKPGGPMPCAGSHCNSTENTTTSTMPNQ